MLTDRHLGTMFCENHIPTFHNTTNLVEATIINTYINTYLRCDTAQNILETVGRSIALALSSFKWRLYTE